MPVTAPDLTPSASLSPASAIATASTETPVPGMDPVAVARWHTHRHRTSPWLHDEVGTRMAERLHWIKTPPASWLNWEPVHGGVKAHQAVAGVLENSKLFVASSLSGQAMSAINADNSVAASLWARVRGRAPALATPDTQVDMVWANMCLHATHQPQAMLQRWHRHLQVDGFVMFSCLGPDSLRELSAVYHQLGWAPPCHSFTDMHDWGDMLVQQGFAAPVMDVETITLTYASIERLVQELRSLGRNLHASRATTTRGRQWLADWQRTLAKHWPRTPDGQLRLSFEVIHGHAFKPAPRVKVAASSAVSLDDMRGMLGASRSARTPR